MLCTTFLPDVNLQINGCEVETWLMTRPGLRMKAGEVQLVSGVAGETASLTPTLDKHWI